LRASQNPVKQLLIDLRQDITTIMNKLQEEMERNKLLLEEKLKLQQMSGPTSTTANPLVYKLEYHLPKKEI
jgi:hypothetical protein